MYVSSGSQSQNGQSSNAHVTYELNILDIVAVILVVISILVTLYIGWKSTHIATTMDSALEVAKSSNEHLQAIRMNIENMDMMMYMDLTSKGMLNSNIMPC